MESREGKPPPSPSVFALVLRLFGTLVMTKVGGGEGRVKIDGGAAAETGGAGGRPLDNAEPLSCSLPSHPPTSRTKKPKNQGENAG